MNTPNPTPNPLAPSSSTVVSLAVATPIVIVISWILDQYFKIVLPPEVAAAVGSLISAGLGYFANGGKAIHTV